MLSKERGEQNINSTLLGTLISGRVNLINGCQRYV